MSNQIPVDDKAAVVSDGRRAAIIALCLMLVGVVIVTTGVWLAFGGPAGLIVLGVLLLGGGIALGLMT